MEALCFTSTTTTVTTTISWICPICGAVQERGDDIGNYEKCSGCSAQTILVGRYPARVIG